MLGKATFGYRLNVRERIQFALLADLEVLPSWLPDVLESSLQEYPDQLLKSLETANLTGRLLSVIQKAGLSSLAPARLMDELMTYRVESELVLATFTKHAYDLASIAASIGVEVSVLKGLHSAHTLYDHSFERNVQDIDVLTCQDSAIKLFRLAEELGYQTGAFNYSTYEFIPKSCIIEIIDGDGHYELPRQWLIFDMELEPEDAALLRLGHTSRCRLIGENLLRIPVSLEVHYRLTSTIKSPRETVPFKLEDGNFMRGLSSTDNIIYLCHKAVTDLIIFKERKGAKLISDIFRILTRERDRLNLNELLLLANQYDLLAVIGNLISAAQSFHEIDSFDDILDDIAKRLRSKRTESWDMGDLLFALLERPVSHIVLN